VNAVSRPGKVLYPDAGITKADVADHYQAIAPAMLPHLRDRFLTLHRFPDGIGAEGFYQQSRSDHFGDSVRGVSAPRAGGGEPIEHMVVDAEDGLRCLADQATLAIHGWQSRCDRRDHPDRLVFDLDPPDGDFQPVIDCARLLHDLLDEAGLTPFVMTTGSSGLHVVCPLDRSLDFEAVRSFAGRVGNAVVERAPERFTREQRKNKRRGRLYVDIGRNAYGQTAIMPYSLRALPGAPVATPLDWDELGNTGLRPQSYRLDNIRRRLGQKADPWRSFFDLARAPSR
jgi:bifunctional non-homologous end joining protein LigD